METLQLHPSLTLMSCRLRNDPDKIVACNRCESKELPYKLGLGGVNSIHTCTCPDPWCHLHNFGFSEK